MMNPDLATTPSLRWQRACGALLALAIGTSAAAQDLTAYDAMDYPSGQSIHDQNGGAGWQTPWVGVGENSLLSWWPMDGSAEDAGPVGAHASLTNASFSFTTPPGLVWSNQSITFGTNPRMLYDLSAHAPRLGTLTRGTITAWIKPVNSKAIMVIFGAANASGKNMQFFIQDGNVNFWIDILGNSIGELIDFLLHKVIIVGRCGHRG